jgi:D-glycero-beta-D-manno-heptose-7-phosphate kinase
MNISDSFASIIVLVVGDVMLDEYVWGNVQRISPEAPVPVVEFRSRTFVAGGAANAAANIVSLTGRALLAGVVGEDNEADALRTELMRCGVEAHLIPSTDRPTTTKSRIIGGSQQVLRIDREEGKQIPPELEATLLEWIERSATSVHSILISDYGKGVVSETLSRGVIEFARRRDAPVIVDPKGRDYSKYFGATVVTPNVGEVHAAAEPLSSDSGDMEHDVSAVRSALPGTALLVTRGQDGVSLYTADESAIHITARKRTVFDVTGAGDTFAATLALALGSGAALDVAAAVANDAAGIVVGKVGTSTVRLGELNADLNA